MTIPIILISILAVLIGAYVNQRYNERQSYKYANREGKPKEITTKDKQFQTMNGRIFYNTGSHNTPVYISIDYLIDNGEWND